MGGLVTWSGICRHGGEDPIVLSGIMIKDQYIIFDTDMLLKAESLTYLIMVQFFKQPTFLRIDEEN